MRENDTDASRLKTLQIEDPKEIAAALRDASAISGDSPILVLWLDEDDLGPLAAPLSEAGGREIYLSSTLSGSFYKTLPDELHGRIHLTHPYALDKVLSRRLIRTKAWLSRKGVAVSDVRLQANTFFAVRVLGDALRHIMGNFVRDYFVEKIEHRMSNATPASVYPSPSLAAGQRFASKGAYIARLAEDEAGGLTAVSEWIIP